MWPLTLGATVVEWSFPLTTPAPASSRPRLRRRARRITRGAGGARAPVGLAASRRPRVCALRKHRRVRSTRRRRPRRTRSPNHARAALQALWDAAGQHQQPRPLVATSHRGRTHSRAAVEVPRRRDGEGGRPRLCSRLLRTPPPTRTLVPPSRTRSPLASQVAADAGAARGPLCRRGEVQRRQRQRSPSAAGCSKRRTRRVWRGHVTAAAAAMLVPAAAAAAAATRRVGLRPRIRSRVAAPRGSRAAPLVQPRHRRRAMAPTRLRRMFGGQPLVHLVVPMLGTMPVRHLQPQVVRALALALVLAVVARGPARQTRSQPRRARPPRAPRRSSARLPTRGRWTPASGVQQARLPAQAQARLAGSGMWLVVVRMVQPVTCHATSLRR